MARWLAIAIACAACAGCAAPAHRASPLAPSQSHASAPRVATFAPSTMKARAPEVATAQPDVAIGRAPSGSGDGAADFVRALRRRAPGLHRCFAAALKADPALRSIRGTLRVTVGATGAVLQAHAAGGPARLDACVDAVVRRLSLPRGVRIELEVPLVFRAS